MRREIKTKSGYKTNIDRYYVSRNGRRWTTIWGKTKAIAEAKKIMSTLFNPNKDKIEIINEYTGECTKLQ